MQVLKTRSSRNVEGQNGVVTFELHYFSEQGEFGLVGLV